jgi:hypothetical protein
MIEKVYISYEESEGCIYTQFWYLYKGFKGLILLYTLALIFLYPSEASEASEVSEVSLALKKEDDLFKQIK